MSHEIDETTGRAAIAYAGNKPPWHKLGTQEQPGWTFEDWIREARINYEVSRVPAYAADYSGNPVLIDGCYFNRREDTGALLGTQTFTDRRVEVQPREIARFIHDFVSTDERFRMQVMGAIKGGAQVWATASFSPVSDDALTIGGERHQAFLLARTGFDGSLATHAYMTTVKAVCANTLAAGWDKSAMITVRHSTRFDAKAAAKQLAKLAQQVERYKQVGDALAQANMAKEAVAHFFQDILDIPRDAKPEDISTRKQNQYADLARAYRHSVAESGAEATGWSCLQAVTRYVDHDRSTRGGESEDEARFVSSQFGSGNVLKGKALGLLMPLIKDRVAA